MIVQFPSSISELNASLADVKMADLMRRHVSFTIGTISSAQRQSCRLLVLEHGVTVKGAVVENEYTPRLSSWETYDLVVLDGDKVCPSIEKNVVSLETEY
jgi:hypothetical protein